MRNTDVVRRFEEEFKNQSNFEIVDELMSQDFVHHLPYPGIPPGRPGMKAIGRAVTGAFRDIHVSVDLVLSEGDLVADRISARGRRTDNGEMTDWVENHIYRLEGARIAELWPAGGPTLS
jgi:hypothetical protein